MIRVATALVLSAVLTNFASAQCISSNLVLSNQVVLQPQVVHSRVIVAQQPVVVQPTPVVVQQQPVLIGGRFIGERRGIDIRLGGRR